MKDIVQSYKTILNYTPECQLLKYRDGVWFLSQIRRSQRKSKVKLIHKLKQIQ